MTLVRTIKILIGAAAVIIGTMVEGFFELNLGDSEPLALFLAVLACGYIALERAPEEAHV